ncbi:PadR family transcriptional regulator [Virgibacillus dokdonensis]|uniref:PadR family transcriptional regulator n=1 Tax=Virgibacillus dokdonensis TaxID=302167 RepID=A0A3E0WJJ5_9BACI|nr:PadR family transcriptional regulator [Virgibacillus dokdonensis]RFA32136.1 PadR family transcriptional regulator [Virgibacillus dokdonensis]
MEVDKELLKGHIDTLILSLLSRRDMYGYEIAKIVRTYSNGSFELKEGTLYLSLKRLENRDWITSYWSDQQGAGARRKYYRMTHDGRYNLKLKIEEWNFVKTLIDAFLNASEEGIDAGS